ncbi:MAG: protein kinase, partial [Acidobacteriia bacterium]|nr:protein kinase [Terriglobia bacterium]
MERLERVLEALSELALRLARGELDEAAHDRLVERVCAGLSAEERVRLGLTPTPAPVVSPRPSSGVRLGPSGPPTRVVSLAELELGPGTVLFEQWRLERELGRGGFGVVFEATELHLKRVQAVKILDPTMVRREELLERFRREVAVMRDLVHRRIVRVYDYREDPNQGLALISMEFVRGCALRDVVVAAKDRKKEITVFFAL